ncbi:TonB-dependent receptor [Sphingomonas quercus]|uniref:TonB-dependent receptor n=1 Tax=Sphingomonas quercus TaxID=2842451 RepID=A0ABS6BGM0_9SPHN|nr:TonB-dependent receptor [Sphingomonas quercus]MBU3076962.1 TonB-dependent receptor [Sphingomonas quercus]
MAVPLPAALPAPIEIVVTGYGLDAARGDAAYDVVSIDRERLNGTASGRLEDVLRDVAGFAQFRRSDARSAHPTSQGATLRGLGGNASSRALLVLDGVPQSDPFGGYVTYSAYDPERLGNVRVTRGGGSGAFGPGALAGTIELSSANASQLAPIWANAGYGSRDSQEANLGVSGRMGGGYAFLSGSFARGDGFIPIVESQRGPVDMPARYQQYSVSGRVVIPAGPDTEIQASGLGFNDTRTRGVPFTPNRSTGADASLRVVGKGRFGWEALAYVQTRSFSSGFASVNDTRSTATATLDQYEVPATGFGGRIELRPPVSDAIQLRLGADTRVTSGRTQELFQFVTGAPTRIRKAGGRNETVGAFAEASVDLADALRLTGGGRIDRWWIKDGFLRETQNSSGAVLTNTRYADRSGWRPTGRAGLAWHPGDAVTVRSAAYLGWRLPTLNELYRPFRAGADATAAEAGLKPERLRGVDAGVDFRPLPGFRASATVFLNRLEDAIGNITVARGPGTFPQVGFVSAAGTFRKRGNIDAIDSKGVELDGSARFGAWMLSASYAYTDAEVKTAGAAIALDGLQPAQTARHQGSATLAWAPAGGPSLAATMRYVGPQYEDDQNSVRLKDATTLDLVGRLPLGKSITVEARAENVTNALVMAGISGGSLVERATPRTLWISFRYGN